MGTTTVPPEGWQLNPDSKLPQKAQSVLAITVTCSILSFVPIPFYWYVWDHLHEPHTAFEASFLYVAGPVVLFWVSYCFGFFWFASNTAGQPGFKSPGPLLISYAWAVLGIPAGSVLFNEALTTPRGTITKIFYLLAGCALVAESVVLVRLVEVGKANAGKFATGRPTGRD